LTCNSQWFYGNKANGLSGTNYGALTRIRTPNSLPDTTCTVAYWVGCTSTTLDEENNPRFYQATIAYTPSVGEWHFSWGYSAEHLSQDPYEGLSPQTNHDYELGIRFTGTQVEAYVVDLDTSTKYTMGTLSDTGTLHPDDKPGLILEGFTDDIDDMGVDAFKAYTFNVFLSPTTSTEWPHALAYKEIISGSIPDEIHTYDLGSHQYFIGNTSSGSQLDNDEELW
jgi:hypothetical protein